MNLVYSRAITLTWIMLDQGLFALSNFIINILFARWLEPTDYGWFVVSFSGAMLVMTLHFLVILEPLLVQSAQVPGDRQRSYVSSVCRGHMLLIAVATILAVPTFFVTKAIGYHTLGVVLITSLVGGTVLVTLYTARRICFILVSPKASATLGGIYLVGCVTTGIAMHASFRVDWLDMWLVIGGWSLLSALATFGLTYRMTNGSQRYSLADVWQFGQHFALWGVVASLCSWIRTDALFLILANIVGLNAVAETRAVFTLGAPLLQINMALQITAIVGFSSNHTHGSKRDVWNITMVYFIGTALLLPLVYQYSMYLTHLVYGGRYLAGAWQLPLYCLSLSLCALDAIISSVFKAHHMMREGYASIIIGGVTSIILGFILIPIQHTLIYATVLSTGVGLCISFGLRMRAKI
jgi:O-antigen/teichoic acid export membrane protein